MEEHRSQKRGSPRGRAILQSVILTALALSGGCASFPRGSGGILQEEIDEIISAPPLDQVNWGIRIVDPERGQILYNRHAHLKFVPASNMKILSTATALSVLGPDYRYQTDLYGVGSFEEGGRVLQGNLHLRATGDPTLSERFYPSAEAPLDSLAQGLWAAGVRGMVGDLPEAYAATGGAFAIAEGVLTVEVRAGSEEGAPAQTRWWPSLGDEFISVSFVTVHPDSSARGRSIQYLPESRRLEIEGRIQAGEVDTLRVSQRDPVRLASAALLHALERRGIEVQGGVRIAWEVEEPVQDYLDATHVAGLTSPPMAEIVKGILETSQNWMTEQLVRTLGMEGGQMGSWREGFQVERDFLTQEVGVDSLDIIYRDGSGMSAYNLVTPRAVVRVLEYMRASSNSGIFRNALASPGEEESTLRSRLLSLESRVFAKTGTITHVNSLSGYVFTDSGKELIFSILTNGSGLSSGVVRAAIDRIVEVVARR